MSGADDAHGERTDDRFDVFRFVVHVEQSAGAERVGQCVVQRAQMVVHFRRHECGEFAVLEVLVFVQRLAKQSKEQRARSTGVNARRRTLWKSSH